MEFRVLGAIELWIDGRRHNLGTPKLQCLFACLALEPNRPVAIDTLVDRLWDGRATDSSRDTLYSYKNRLNKRLAELTDGRVHIAARGHGYALEIDEESIDLHRHLRLREQGTALASSGLIHEAAVHLRTAEEAWNGEPLAGLTGLWAERVRDELNDGWLEMTRARIRCELMLSRFSEVIGELRRLVAEHPYDDVLVEYLMRALHGCGRRAMALAAYDAHRKRTIAELEAEPGPELKALHRQLLTGRVEPLDPPPAAGESPPNNLKRDIPEFTGRDAELAQIIESLPRPGSGIAVPVQAVHGMPGAGKTAFAIRLAHQLIDRYPDAQLFVDLHGHDLAHGATEPRAALERLLQVLGVPPGQIPEDHDARAEFWRSRMADRRAIVVLDNAANGEQVRDLFPGAPDCLVIVTSRVRLSGLPGVTSRSLGTLPEDDGSRLFADIVDDTSRTSDRTAIGEVVRLCGGLPLAIRLAAARLKERSSWTVRDVVRRLEREGGRLGELRAGNETVRPAFESSYRDLGTRHQQAFRMLSLHFGEEFSVHAAAAILDVSPEDADRILDELLECHLLEESGSERFRFHDLLRDYAKERTALEDAEPILVAAERRLIQYYVDVAACADGVLQPYLPAPELRTPAHRLPAMPTFTGALDRLEMELSGMLDVARNRHEATPRLAHDLAYYLDLANHWNAAAEIHDRALEKLRADGDLHGELACVLDRTLIELRLSRYDQARRTAQGVLEAARVIGDLLCEAGAHDRLGLVHMHLGEYDDAIERFGRACTVYERERNRKGVAESVAHIAMSLLQLRQPEAALARYHRAQTIYHQIGDRRGEGHTLIGMGEVHRIQHRFDDALDYYEKATPFVEETMGPLEKAIHRSNIAHIWRQQGRYEQALEAYREVLGTYRLVGDRPGEAETMNDIGVTLADQRRSGAALIHLQGALAIAQAIGDPVEEFRSLNGIGTVHLGDGRHEKALESFEEAHRVADRLGRPYERASVAMALGRVLRRVRGEDAAHPFFREAADLFDVIGAAEAVEARALLDETSASSA